MWATAISAVYSSESTFTPALNEAMLLLNVPACEMQSGELGSNLLITSARPPNAPNEKPAPMYLPNVFMSGAAP